MTTNKLFTGDDITTIVCAMACILTALVLTILAMALPGAALIMVPPAISLTVTGLVALGLIARRVRRDLRPKRRATHR